MIKQPLSNAHKQIKLDWTLAEWRCPVRNDVIIDDDNNEFIVTKTAGSMGQRLLWANDIEGNIAYEGVNAEEFIVADIRKTERFYEQYRQNIGWKPGKIFTIRGKDYPLVLKALEYDTVRHKMIYVLSDINTPELKLFKTYKEDILEPASSDMYDVAETAFIEDDSSSLRYNLSFNIVDRGESFHDGWSVSGNCLSFGEKEQAEIEIERIKCQNEIRRMASVFSLYPKTNAVQFSVQDDNVFIEDFKFFTGQPGIFNSRIIAGIVLSILGEEKIKKALSYEHDSYLL